ncbi:HIV-1 Tat interactive protein 2 [Martensiomyces pterosporus]|nr:HIV-1 Tat interactive protein 2 [Martensiomyces pterosporus]
MASAVKIIGDKLALSDAFRKAALEFKERAPGKSALVLGGTGEVGREVVKHLLVSDAFDRVTVFTRRPIEYTGVNADKLVQKPVDFENTEQLERDFSGHTHAFSCLGTTRAKNGSEAFYKVDHDYVLNAANACRKASVEHYSICSSSGADKNSRFLYIRTKGEVDAEVQALEFPRASIFRPAMLECDREEARLVERISMYVLPVLKLFAPRSVAIPTSTVAWAMVSNAFAPVETPVSEIFSNADMIEVFKKSN